MLNFQRPLSIGNYEERSIFIVLDNNTIWNNNAFNIIFLIAFL